MEVSVHQPQQVDIFRTALSDVQRFQVKSVERVRDLGEVFTPAGTVQAMLDLLPADLWDVHPSAAFFEPACGDGNFVVAILERKLATISQARLASALPAGANDSVEFYVLEALASIYAVDISADNIIGGTPGHEVGARDRLLAHLERWYTTSLGLRLNEDSELLVAARWVVERNIQIGNMLAFNPNGTPSGREQLPLVEYHWDAKGRTVRLFTTTLGTVMAASAAETSDTMTLFGTPGPTEVWEGDPLRLYEAPIDAPVSTVNHTRNGKRGQ